MRNDPKKSVKLKYNTAATYWYAAGSIPVSNTGVGFPLAVLVWFGDIAYCILYNTAATYWYAAGSIPVSNTGIGFPLAVLVWGIGE